MVTKQQIMEVDEKCSQTGREVQEFKEVVNTKITNIEETNRTKLEEHRKETQEELGKVQNQVMERYDGMEVAMKMCIRDSFHSVAPFRNLVTYLA